jgi:hypothetical protein
MKVSMQFAVVAKETNRRENDNIVISASTCNKGTRTFIYSVRFDNDQEQISRCLAGVKGSLLNTAAESKKSNVQPELVEIVAIRETVAMQPL